VTGATLDLLASVRPAVLRTARHPAAEALAVPGGVLDGVPTFDEVYESADRLDAVYETIVARLGALLAEAGPGGQVLYAVPGSPAVAERTVELLRAQAAAPAASFDLEVHPALSFADLAWARLGIDPLTEGVRIVDGQRFEVQAAGQRGPLLVAQCDSATVLSDIKLAVDDGPDSPVVVVQRLGLPDESIVAVPWDDLDRTVRPDHLTSVYIPELAAPVAGEIVRLTQLMHTLRTECPWDREQTHQSLIRHLVEEAYEVVEALEALPGDDDERRAQGYAHLEEELGDLLFQIVFHAELATESGEFGLDDVARNVHDKLYARHPHVFAPPGEERVVVDGASGVEANWERIKRAEKSRESAMDGIPVALPALLFALKSHERAARAGMPFPSVASAAGKVREELAELEAELPDVGDPRRERLEDELGDLLFAAVGLAHELDIEPEGALRGAAHRFQARFRAVESLAAAEGTSVGGADAERLDRWWDAAKAGDAGAGGVPGRSSGDD
jgi:tetrapyrrole methylase family protein/MazG family protein